MVVFGYRIRCGVVDGGLVRCLSWIILFLLKLWLCCLVWLRLGWMMWIVGLILWMVNVGVVNSGFVGMFR